MKKSRCWPLLPTKYRTPLIISSVDLYSHLTSEWHTIEPIIIDTGYDGDLLLSNTQYQELGFTQFELPSFSFDIAQSIDQSDIILQASISKVRWGEWEFETRVESLSTNEETILGRGLYLKVSSCYEKKNHEFCLYLKEKDDGSERRKKNH